MLATSIMALASGTPAFAQQPSPGANAPVRATQPGPRPAPDAAPGRWGGRVNGRWYAGVYAPGGWAAYRRPVVGWVLPTYWSTPSFHVTDWAGYGLPAPRAGYSWSRYYDDAVLVDQRGRVADVRSGIDWEGERMVAATPPPKPAAAPPPPPRVASASPTRAAAPDAPPPPRMAATPPPPPPAIAPPAPPRAAGAPPPAVGAPYAPPPPRMAETPPPARRDSGVGGAAIGAVAGGVAGNVIAGRGNRLGGTLVGAGVGALAGMAIDKAEDRRRSGDRRYRDDRYYDEPPVARDDYDYADASPYGAPYPEPYSYDDDYDYPPPLPGHHYPPPADAEVVFDDGVTRTMRYSGDRPYTTVTHGPGFVTTVTVVPATTTTSTTTDYVAPIVTRRSVGRVTYPAKTKLRRR